MLWLVVLAVLFVLYAAYRRFGLPGKSKKAPVDSGYILVYDGARATLYACVATPIGIEVYKDRTYPYGTFDAVLPLPGVSGRFLWVLGAEQIALATHEALERARPIALLGTVFKPGGDLLRYLQFAAVLVPIFVCILLFMQFGTVNATLNRTSADLAIVREIVAKTPPPAFIRPSPTPTPTVEPTQ